MLRAELVGAMDGSGLLDCLPRFRVERVGRYWRVTLGEKLAAGFTVKVSHISLLAESNGHHGDARLRLGRGDAIGHTPISRLLGGEQVGGDVEDGAPQPLQITWVDVVTI